MLVEESPHAGTIVPPIGWGRELHSLSRVFMHLMGEALSSSGRRKPHYLAILEISLAIRELMKSRSSIESEES